MAVHYAQSGGGLFDSLLSGLGMAATFVPGMQGIAPYLMGANALAKGDVGGAIGSVVAPAIGRSFDSANATAAIDASNRDSLFDAVINAERGYAPADPWESFRNGLDWTEFQRRWR